jgi:AP-1 complex subunit beta-1
VTAASIAAALHTPAPASTIPSGPPASTADLLGGLGFGAAPAASGPPEAFAWPKEQWLPASKGKGLEVSGTMARRRGVMTLEMTLANRSMQPLSDFAIQFNKNSFGLAPAGPLTVPVLQPNSTFNASVPLSHTGPVQKMDPLDKLQVGGGVVVLLFLLFC